MSSSPPDRAAVFAAVRSVMARVFGIPADSISETTLSSHVERWDSLNMVVVAIGLERRLGRSVDPGSLARIRSIPALLDLLCAPPG